jgi:protein-tyrosine phosphatase
MDGMARHRQEDCSFRLLFVCTGNICRSPFAEILTRHLLVGRLGGRAAAAFDVSSAGVQAVVGAQMHPDSRDQLSPWGLDRVIAGKFAARQLRSGLVEQAHLVLGAGPRHRSAVVERAPAALATAFSLREFARLAAAVDQRLLPAEPVARAHALVEQARLQRGLAPPEGPEADRIPDPMGRPPRAHHEAAVLISAAVQSIVDVIAPPAVPRSAGGAQLSGQ